MINFPRFFAPGTSLFAGLILASAVAQPAASDVTKFNGATPLVWSQRLADSEMKRLGNSLEAGQDKARWDYSPGVLALSLVRLGETTHHEAYVDFGTRAVASHVRPDL